jgi:hypothetical protein
MDSKSSEIPMVLEVVLLTSETVSFCPEKMNIICQYDEILMALTTATYSLPSRIVRGFA